jgi:hypothetical protein
MDWIGLGILIAAVGGGVAILVQLSRNPPGGRA